MKISIRVKFTIGLSIILIIAGVALNILINEVFKTNFENTIKGSMQDIMKNSREYISYRLIYKNLPLNSDSLDSEAGDISDYFMSTYNCENQVLDMKGNLLGNSNELPKTALTKEAAHSAIQGKAIIMLSYSKNDAVSSLSFPLCYDGKYIGIITLNKSFAELYNYNNTIIRIITAIEAGIFMAIFILLFLCMSYIVKPLKILTIGLKSVGKGNYGINLKVNSNDEIGNLSREFMDMEQKIESQIHIINLEKDKVLKLENSRRQFFSNVTHELKTPLTAISGYAQMLMNEKLVDNEFKNRAVQRIYMESERMHKLVLDLISVARGISYDDEEKQIVNMSELLNEICNDMYPKVKKYSISLKLGINEGYVIGKCNKLRQLIINILDNAIKYSFKAEQVFIEAYEKGNYYVIKVTNRGEPITEKIYKNIFEPFVRGKKDNEVGSSGLGLYICKEIVEEHNGQITIENGELIKVIIKIPSFGNNLETT